MEKIRRDDLLADFRRMLDEHWSYADGAEEEGRVDCSGAFVWAYRQHGKSIPHGSNRIARTAVLALLPISEAWPGMAAFKAREPGDPGYDLPEAYQPGGAYDTGDLRDYYHIGLIDADGVHVLNARSETDGFVSSPLSDGWEWVAELTDVDHGGTPQTDFYLVTGGRLNLREGPGKQFGAVKSIPDGEIVTALGAASGEWIKVRSGRESGFVMREFLIPLSGGETEDTVKMPRSKWTALVTAFGAASAAIKEETEKTYVG